MHYCLKGRVMRTRVLFLASAVVIVCSMIVGGVWYYILLHEVAEAKATDPTGDLFDKDGKPSTGERYLDIVESQISLQNDTYFVTIKVDGPLPMNLTDPSIFVEWDVFIDSDLDPSTGWAWSQADIGWEISLIANDIGPEHLLRMGTWPSRPGVFLGENIRENGMRGFIGYQVDGDVIELHFPKEIIGSPASFNYVIAVRKHGEGGAPHALLVADKAPQQGHYVFHAQYVDRGIVPRESFAMLESEHAVILYQDGDDDYIVRRAAEIAEGFELTHMVIGEDIPAYPAQDFTIYIYRSQGELLEGLVEYSYFPPELIEFFRKIGPPRPFNYVMHITKDCQQMTVAHEVTHTFIEEFSGNAYLSAKWLDEGLAEYESYRFGLRSKYNQSAEMWKYAKMNAVHNLCDQGRLYTLGSISTEQQWGDLMTEGYTTEIYAQAFAFVEYLCQTYRTDRCLSILRFIQEGQDHELLVVIFC